MIRKGGGMKKIGYGRDKILKMNWWNRGGRVSTLKYLKKQ